MAKNYGRIYLEPYDKAVRNINKIIELLRKTYPKATRTDLHYNNPFELLIATILAAQSTDKMVNKITESLFKKYKDPADFANADVSELQKDIKPAGFFRNKSNSIIECSKNLIEKFGGKVPDNIEDLNSLHGVGRKTANVVLANAFGKQAIIVDTHMLRVSNLIGLTINKDPEKVEIDLQKIVPLDNWSDFSHKMVAHGRNICIAGKPKCEICPVSEFCRYYNYEWKDR